LRRNDEAMPCPVMSSPGCPGINTRVG
jgi:hypothetical protein